MNLSADLREFIELLNSHGVEYVIVGAYTLAFHARPRYTGDIDIFVRPAEANASRLMSVLDAFGFGGIGITQQDFTALEQVIQLGRAPNRIDLLTGLSNVSFDEAWEKKLTVSLSGIPVFLLNKELLIQNKRATGRAQDLADLQELEGGETPQP